MLKWQEMPGTGEDEKPFIVDCRGGLSFLVCTGHIAEVP